MIPVNFKFPATIVKVILTGYYFKKIYGTVIIFLKYPLKKKKLKQDYLKIIFTVHIYFHNKIYIYC